MIALHGASSLTDFQNNQKVPFYLQPTLGGPDSLRGFRYGRFYGNNSALLITQFCETRRHKVYVWRLSQRPPIKTVARSSFRF